MFERPDRIADPLHVVTPIFNSRRFRSRWALYEKFAKHVRDAGAILHTVELAFGDRALAVTDPQNPAHVQLRTGHDRVGHELWFKENLVNLGIQRLPADWRYAAWIDADVQFARPDWVGETLHQLQQHHVVQMFSEAHQLSAEFETVQRYWGFAHCHQHRDDVPPLGGKAAGDYYTCGRGGAGYWHPGFAWAARRDALDHLGGLVDWAILGGADLFMAHALVGTLDGRRMPRSLGATGVRWLREWQGRAERHVGRNIGCVPGLLLHHWHGRRADRAYKDRGQILVDAGFDPELDLKRDCQGVWQLTDRSPGLRDGLRRYFQERNEDAT